MSSFVDSELAASAGFANAINWAPGIKERIAASRITLEKADHAERVLDLMADFGTDKSRYNSAHDWAARAERDADIEARRQGGDMRLSVFHYPLAGWTDAVVMNVLMGLATDVQLAEMARASYTPLAEVLREIAPRERRHTELGLEGLERLVAQGKAEEARASVAYWSPRVAETFGPAESQRYRDASPDGATARAQRGDAGRMEGQGRRGARAARARLRRKDITMDATAREPRRLESYLCGAWQKGAGEGTTLLDAATGEPVR